MRRHARSGILELVSLRRNHKPLIQDDVDGNQEPLPKKASGGRFGGWKGTLYLGSITSFIVLLLNLAMLSWATLRHSSEGKSVLYSGDCDRVKEISAGIHFLINILSTLLLSASNFGMQCLSAPTRQDVDRAHGRKKWLDIGVPSVRNLWRIPKSRLLLWLCLVVSSVPLHLVYNSTVYSTIAANAYNVFVGDSNFTSLQPDDVNVVYDERIDLEWSPLSAPRLVAMSNTLEKLMPEDCISAYATKFQTQYGSLVVISDEFNASKTAINMIDGQAVASAKDEDDTDPYQWICASRRGSAVFDRCADHVSDIRSQDDWIVRGYRVDYCLAERTPEKCTLEYSLPLAIAVVVANFGKTILICLAAVLLRDFPLLTIGDSIASFLRLPAERTRGKCLLSRELIEYKAEPTRRWSSLSTSRWVICLFTYTSSIILCISLLGYGLAKIDNQDQIWDSGLASVDTKTMINSLNWPGGLIPNTLIANIPQFIFSLLYFMSNSVLTTMTLATEWNNFSLNRKGLRVSTPPEGHQRRTYFLSLPYRFGIPLITLSALLHWLMSQSIFLVRIIAYTERQERDPISDTMTVGYSPPAIVICLCVGALLPAGLIAMGRRRFKSGMPVAGSCSLAIAAACHPRTEGDGDDKSKIEYQLLKWGAEPNESGEVGHCSFSESKVHAPEDGVVYR
ncbi:hypothetical protein BDW59DRAFT_169440 [Aspergillus cavernicola]|uniref:DUF6536 domain-containing protein n=1 Tax=Aspergillus cavernicola TaxID=176166 RepID=A0ABR4IYI8_9EURO